MLLHDPRLYKLLLLHCNYLVCLSSKWLFWYKNQINIKGEKVFFKLYLSNIIYKTMKYAKLLYMRYLIAYYVLFIFIAIYHAVKTRDLFNWFSTFSLTPIKILKISNKGILFINAKHKHNIHKRNLHTEQDSTILNHK
jgi:hypothetical protein